MTDRTCSLPGCDKPGHARRMCPTHYKRWLRHGDPEIVVSLSGPDNPSWKDGRAGYHVAHKLLRKARGSASSYECGCGARAEHWAYDHSDPDELMGLNGAYSTDTSRYMPLCQPCHAAYDAIHRKIAGAQGCGRNHHTVPALRKV